MVCEILCAVVWALSKAPTWEKLAEKCKGFVNIGQVDCTTDKAVCESMEVRGYPTLKIIRNGKSVEYKGAREMQAFLDELSKKFGDKPVLSPLEAIDKIKQEEVALVFYSYAETLPEAVEQVISDIGLELPAVRVKGYWPDRAAYNIQNSPSLLIIKDGKVLEFTGSLSDQGQMLEWVTKEQHPMVRSIDPNSLRKMFELDEGLVVIKVGSGVTRASDAKSFRNFAEPILRRTSSVLFFGIMDADDSEISQWFMFSGKVDPKIVMLDLKTRKFYSANVYGTPIGFNYKEIQDAIETQKAGKLTGFALKFNNNPSLMTLSLTVILPIVVIFAVICYFVLTGEPDDEEKKKV
ncbi:hypothetical protein DSO57_1007102 [Entomophthora muscae]|uniref:Uncharacterized protein n=1 Tax=Entomophthora muscae TaxID=34485 RepID=A0ACC2TVJ8_9FUNG|nr:hypothetical protein DSO57_1007102 [Entomophthora muscae]